MNQFERAHASYQDALNIYRQHYVEESPEIQACYANISTFPVNDQIRKLFRQSNFSEESRENTFSTIGLSTIKSVTTLFSAANRLMPERLAPRILNVSTLERLVTQSIGSTIIFYICPCCTRHVWIYKVFAMFEGLPCFECMRRVLFFGPNTVRK